MNSFRSGALVCAFILFATICVAQDLSQKVTFSSNAATAKVLLEKLTKQTGVTFVASVPTANDVLIVDVKDVTLTDLMAKIAEASGAEWQKDSEGYRLVRPQALINQQDREYLSARAAAFKAEIDKMSRVLAGKGAFTGYEPKKAADQTQSGLNNPQIKGGGLDGDTVRITMPFGADNAPITRALARILAAMNPVDLASIPAGSRVVFALTPTQTQRLLPGGAVNAINLFAREQQKYVQAEVQAQPEATQAFKLIFFGQDTRPNPIRGGVAEAMLVVQRYAGSESLQIELKVADQTGQFVGQAMRTLQGPDVRSGNAGGKATQFPKNESITVSESGQQHAKLMAIALSGGGDTFMVKMSGNSTAAVRMVTASGGPDSPPPAVVSPEWRSILSNPDQFEPLGFAVSELLMGMAKAQGGNIVAGLPDSALVPLSRRSFAPVTPSELAQILRMSLGILVNSSDGWTIIKPKYHSLARLDRVDRVALGNMLRSIAREGRLSLDAAGRYALGRRQPSMGGLEAIHVSLIDAGAGSAFNSAVGNWKMVQLYATFDASRRETLADGGTLRLGAMTPQQSAIVRSMVFDEPGGPERKPRQQAQAPGLPGQIEQRSVSLAFSLSVPPGGGSEMFFATLSTSSLMDERTEYLPFGVPRDGMLAMRWQKDAAVYASNSANASSGRYFTAEDYGSMQGFNFGALEGAPSPNVQQYDRFKQGYIIRMTFSFAFTPEASMSRELQDAGTDPASGWGSFAQLPEDFRMRAEAARKVASEASSKIRMAPSGGRGNINPPPNRS